MKLVVQIPCFNEADSLPEVIADIPRVVAGFDSVEVLVVDDGSTDTTAQVAIESGADHVHRLPRNRGLARAFSAGIQCALELGADVIVNTDGDHQYRGSNLPALVAPILQGQADMVVGDRRVSSVPHFSITKKVLQRLGSWVVRWLSGTSVVDATSGFRAISRDAALRLFVFSTYTYTLETIIQAGKKGLAIVSVPVAVNPTRRESRLISSVPRYVVRSGITILRIFLLYEPFKVFSYLSLVPGGLGLVLLARYLYFFSIRQGQGHVQSVVVGSVLLLLALQVFLLGLLADLVAKNRQLDEDIIYHQRLVRFAVRSEAPQGLRVEDTTLSDSTGH